jgi:tetratricopeptide (TPR) repeat protein
MLNIRIPYKSAVLLLLACSGLMGGLQAATADTVQDLLRSARWWESKFRPELVRSTLEKILAIQPTHPDALGMLADLDLRANKPDAARKILATLKASHPQHRLTRDVSELIRVYTTEREKLASMRLLLRAGRKQEAMAMVKELFPSGPPAIGDFPVEYFQVTGSTAAGAGAAQRELETLYSDTGDARYQLAAIALQVDRGTAPSAAGMKALYEMAAKGDVPRDRMQDVWKKAISRQPDNAQTSQYIRQYLGLYPGDTALAERAHQADRAAAEQRRIATDPGLIARAQGEKALNANSLVDAEQRFTTALARYPNDGDSLGGLGLVRLRQGQHAQAVELFRKAQTVAPSDKWRSLLATATFYASLRAGEALVGQQQWMEAETALQDALVLRPRDADALTALAQVRVGQGRDGEAERLFHDVLKLEPDNGTAFRGLQALYGSAGRRNDSLALMKSFTERFPAQKARFDGDRAGLLRDEADEAARAGRQGQAIRALEEAVKLVPTDPWARYALAKAYRDVDLHPAALQVMDEGVAVAATDASMRYARALIRASLDDAEGAVRDVEAVAPADLTDGMRALLARSWVNLRAAQAEQLAGSGQLEAASAMLRFAEQRAGNDADLVYTVANTWFRIGQPLLGVAAFGRLVDSSVPLEPALLMDYVGLIARADDDAGLERVLPRLEQTALANAAQTARVVSTVAAYWTRKVNAAVQAGEPDRVSLIARQADASLDRLKVTGQADVLKGKLQVAEAAAQPDRVVDLAAELLLYRPGDVDARLEYTRALAAGGRKTEVAKEARWLTAHIPPQDVDSRLGLLRLLQRTGLITEANALSRDLIQRYPDSADVFAHAARLARSQGYYTLAVGHFRTAQALELNPSTKKVIPALSAKASSAIEIEPLPALLPEEASAMPAQASTLRLTSAVAEPPTTAAVQTPVVAPAPELAPEVSPKLSPITAVATVPVVAPPIPVAATVAATPLEPAEQGGVASLLPSLELQLRPNDVRLDLKVPQAMIQAPARPAPTPSPATPTDRFAEEIRAIEARQQGRTEMGFELLRKNSADGVATLNGWEMPLKYWMPRGYEGHLFGQVDVVHLDAGRLSSNYADALELGTVAARPGVTNLGPQFNQRVTGANVGLGYVGDDIRWDIGRIGLGMLIGNMVGGIRVGGEWGKLDYSIDASRRAMTGSMLSYAGVRDPVTQQVWGGVVNTGVTGRLGTSYQGYNLSTSLNLARITGQQVQGNNRVVWRSALDRDLIKRDDLQLNLGAALSFTRHARDLGGFTWGHGGYYSPEHLASLVFPVELSGQVGRFNYALAASVSLSRSASSDTAYFPTDAGLQAAAALNAVQFPLIAPNPVYKGGSSTGLGYALRALVEYPMTDRMLLGGRVELDRADFYSPTNWQVYLRYFFDPMTAERRKAVPSAIVPYARF